MPRVTVACNDANLRIGQDHQNAKLTDREVDTIRDLYERGDATITALGQMFEVSKGTIHDIVNYRRRAQMATHFRTINVPG